MAVTRTRIVVIALATLALGMLLPQLYVVWIRGQKPTVYRIAFPEDRELTERAAIELTKQALVLDGKSTVGMRPVASGHNAPDGREILFLHDPNQTDSGSVLWWLQRIDCTWEYSVGVQREGMDVVCTIVKPL